MAESDRLRIRFEIGGSPLSPTPHFTVGDVFHVPKDYWKKGVIAAIPSTLSTKQNVRRPPCPQRSSRTDTI